MSQIVFEAAQYTPTARLRTELVERKGLGHPDTICDSVMEAASLALCRAYVAECGRDLHHNIDKGLLVAGQSSPAVGGGTVLAPMRIIFGDRATADAGGKRIAVGEIVEQAARGWLKAKLRFVDPAQHVVFQNEIQPGSPELADIFTRDTLTANDTSAGVGYAPLTETEQLVLQAENYLNSFEFKQRFPAVGEDIKVMGARQERSLSLTIATAFVDRFIPDETTYLECKLAVLADVQRYLERSVRTLDSLSVTLNTLDVPGRRSSACI